MLDWLARFLPKRDRASILAKAQAIEDELRRIDRWQSEELPPQRYINMGAFGLNTMSAEQWLQFVLLPNVRELIKNKKTLPTESAVAIWADRNFNGDSGAQGLCALLYEFDRLFV